MMATVVLIWYSNAAATSWNSLANVFGASDQSIETFSCYHPGEKCILFGGGNGGPRVGRFNADATFTELGNSPYAWGGGGSNPSKGIVVGHPNGRAFAVSAQQDGMWEYIASTDTWTQSGLVNGGTLPFLDAWWMSCCMIPEHDVIYVCIQTSDAATAPLEHWLYKL
jgi:hypothetical protein